MAHSAPRTILHIDMDAFYASVEQRDNPAYAGKPLVVGALPGTRGVVSAASYEARTFGVHSAMPIREAHGRCPQGIFVRPRMEVYSRESAKVMDILTGFSPALEQVSIDEAFLDVSGTQRLWGSPLATAQTIAGAIRTQLRITASIGIGPNKFLAKLASDMHKPSGITVVPQGAEAVAAWLAPLPARRMWGVGPKAEAMLASAGIRTVGDLQQLPVARLRRLFGAWGDALHELCRGIDERPVQVESDAARSISRENTFDQDTADRDQLERTLLSLSQDVARQARQAGLKGRTVVLIYRLSDFNKHSRRTTLPAATDLGKSVYEEALRLLAGIPAGTKVRLIGVGLTGFGADEQLDLFSAAGKREDWEKSERTIDKIEEKFGEGVVRRGREVGTPRRGPTDHYR